MSQNDASNRGLFGALLRHWRRARNLSQLELAGEANLSTRHLSFLETGRSRPGQALVARLARALSMDAHDEDAFLRAAGFPGTATRHPLSGEIPAVVNAMKRHHNPYPLIVMDSAYELLDWNTAATLLFATVLSTHVSSTFPKNSIRAVFAHDAFRPHILSWEHFARELVARIQREVLDDPQNTRLAGLLDEILNLPEVPASWREDALGHTCSPIFSIGFQSPLGDTLRFQAAVTTFNAPQNFSASRLRIESYYPLDSETHDICTRLFEQGATRCANTE